MATTFARKTHESRRLVSGSTTGRVKNVLPGRTKISMAVLRAHRARRGNSAQQQGQPTSKHAVVALPMRIQTTGPQILPTACAIPGSQDQTGGRAKLVRRGRTRILMGPLNAAAAPQERFHRRQGKPLIQPAMHVPRIRTRRQAHQIRPCWAWTRQTNVRCVPVRLHERGVVKRSGRTGNRTCLLMHADAFSMMLRDREVIWSVDSEGNPVTDEWPGCRAGSLAFTTSASIQLLCRWIWRREIRFQKWCMQPPILIPWGHGALAFPPTTSLHLSWDISRYKKCAKTMHRQRPDIHNAVFHCTR